MLVERVVPHAYPRGGSDPLGGGVSTPAYLLKPAETHNAHLSESFLIVFQNIVSVPLLFEWLSSPLM